MLTKSISDSFSFSYKNKQYFHLTESLNREDIIEKDNTFFPSLFQNEIPKLCEIRSFYIDKKFYSMAIFSQLEKQTRIDFRNYNYLKEQRIALFELPENIKEKLKQLMISLKLDTGSIDLIYTKNNDFIFLEVNPVGIFDMISRPCNYYLEKIISEYLIKKSKNGRTNFK